MTQATPKPRSNVNTQMPGYDGWRLLQVTNVIRCIVGALALIIGNLPVALDVLAPRYPDWFGWAGGLLLASSLTWWITLSRRWPRFNIQSYAQILFDLTLIGMLVASVGVDRGMGVLLMLPVFMCSLLLERWAAYMAAAVSYFTLVGIQFHALTSNLIERADYTQIGTLGMVFFITALVGHLSAQRARVSESRAMEAGVDLRNISELNRHVIRDMDMGVIVVDSDEQVRLLNVAAQRLLGLRQSAINTPMGRISAVLAARLGAWKKNADQPVNAFSSGTRRLAPTFRALGQDSGGGTLIYLEDAERINQRVQQAKLAALGRLTASIAHEIRNPLAAISHASQLMAESEDLNPETEHLTRIVDRNVARMNQIIENVLQMSRRQKSKPESLLLAEQVSRFATEFREMHKLEPNQVQVLGSKPGRIEFDPGQLQQILHGLGHNALKHGGKPGQPIVIRLNWDNAGGHRWLDVRDNGPGINPAVAERIFEPFFSSAKDGTGLGLYIIKELCEANGARLEVNSAPEPGACFRILFYD